MIGRLRGTVVHRGGDYVLFEVGAVAYRLEIPAVSVAQFGGEMTLYTHEVVRDDAHELFAFLTLEALELFWKLIGISGVGPRSAQKIVFADHVGVVRAHIMKGNIAFLTHIHGVGTKTAQKIILELKGVLMDAPAGPVVDVDALDALLGLGYKRADAVRALEGLSGSAEEQVRAALKQLARQ
ncbi:Holliday junction branch migration protein RuvA [Candidatus Uhrbacteria bacterium]|nr:Holliday junction branch migration protein RuvA [Candidatus Uhrbacteria bacterium]